MRSRISRGIWLRSALCTMSWSASRRPWSVARTVPGTGWGARCTRSVKAPPSTARRGCVRPRGGTGGRWRARFPVRADAGLEMAHPEWEPGFVDYVYLSFTNATAFSPADVLPLSRWAKLMMLVQSLVSLVTVALVIARAVNILK